MAERVEPFTPELADVGAMDALEAGYAWVAAETYARERAEAAQRAADYATSVAWTDRLGPVEIIGRWRLPTTASDAWQSYVHGQWVPATYEQVKAAMASGGADYYNRTLALSTYTADPLGGWPVPNPIFLVPESILLAWERPR